MFQRRRSMGMGSLAGLVVAAGLRFSTPAPFGFKGILEQREAMAAVTQTMDPLETARKAGEALRTLVAAGPGERAAKARALDAAFGAYGKAYIAANETKDKEKIKKGFEKACGDNRGVYEQYKNIPPAAKGKTPRTLGTSISEVLDARFADLAKMKTKYGEGFVDEVRSFLKLTAFDPTAAATQFMTAKGLVEVLEGFARASGEGRQTFFVGVYERLRDSKTGDLYGFADSRKRSGEGMAQHLQRYLQQFNSSANLPQTGEWDDATLKALALYWGDRHLLSPQWKKQQPAVVAFDATAIQQEIRKAADAQERRGSAAGTVPVREEPKVAMDDGARKSAEDALGPADRIFYNTYVRNWLNDRIIGTAKREPEYELYDLNGLIAYVSSTWGTNTNDTGLNNELAAGKLDRFLDKRLLFEAKPMAAKLQSGSNIRSTLERFFGDEKTIGPINVGDPRSRDRMHTERVKALQEMLMAMAGKGLFDGIKTPLSDVRAADGEYKQEREGAAVKALQGWLRDQANTNDDFFQNLQAIGMRREGIPLTGQFDPVTAKVLAVRIATSALTKEEFRKETAGLQQGMMGPLPFVPMDVRR